MRKLFSIFLLLFIGLPAASPLFAISDDATLPACCRRNGAHHCMAGMTGMDSTHSSAQPGTTMAQQIERCPYCPSCVASVHPDILAPRTSAAIYAALVSHPTGTAQTESLRRIASDRSSQKRGPPASFRLQLPL